MVGSVGVKDRGHGWEKSPLSLGKLLCLEATALIFRQREKKRVENDYRFVFRSKKIFLFPVLVRFHFFVTLISLFVLSKQWIPIYFELLKRSFCLNFKINQSFQKFSQRINILDKSKLTPWQTVASMQWLSDASAVPVSSISSIFFYHFQERAKNPFGGGGWKTHVLFLKV